MNTYKVTWCDPYNEWTTFDYKASRFFIDESGCLLFIDENEQVSLAYATKVWKVVSIL